MAEGIKDKRNKTKGSSSIVKGYLFLYNFAQVIGWSYLYYLIVKHYVAAPRDVALWDTVKPIVVIFQNAAVLEIVHVALGLVPSNLAITAIQVFSRVMVVCGVLLATPTAPASPGLPLLLFAWSITEIIRYMYYVLNLVNAVPHALIWCRYTFFYVLYPVGVTGELLCMYYAQAYARDTQLWSYTLPNPWNYTFSYQYFIVTIMLLYIPTFPQMYLHMFAQRRKILGVDQKKKK